MKQQVVKCRDCGHENPAEYRFCGMCGRELPEPSSAFPPETEYREELPMPDFRRREPPPYAPPRSETSISGPSFLGIGDEASTPEFSYLLEDEPSRGPRRVLVALILLVALGAAGWWQVRKHGGREWLYAVVRDPKLLTQVGKSEDGVPANRLNRSKAALEQSASNPNASKETDLEVQGQTLVPKDGKPVETEKASPDASTSQSGAASAKETPGASPEHVNAEEAVRKQAASQDEEDEPSTKQATADRSQAAVRKPAAEGSTRTKATPGSGEEQTSAKESETTALQSANAESDASVRVAEKYLYGQGVPQDCSRALTLLRSAADSSNSKARSLLGTMYATGHCVPRDLPNSYHWLALALREEPNNRWLSRDLQSVWNQMSDSEKQTAMRMTR